MCVCPAVIDYCNLTWAKSTARALLISQPPRLTSRQVSCRLRCPELLLGDWLQKAVRGCSAPGSTNCRQGTAQLLCIHKKVKAQEGGGGYRNHCYSFKRNCEKVENTAPVNRGKHCWILNEINWTSFVVGSYIWTSHLLCVLQEGLIYTNQTSQIFPAEGKLQQNLPVRNCMTTLWHSFDLRMLLNWLKIISIPNPESFWMRCCHSCEIYGTEPQTYHHLFSPVSIHLRAAILSFKSHTYGSSTALRASPRVYSMSAAIYIHTPALILRPVPQGHRVLIRHLSASSHNSSSSLPAPW